MPDKLMCIAFGPYPAQVYERQMGRWSRLLAPAFIDFINVRGGEKVLDVGCGTGSLTYALAERAPDITIVGIDPLESSLDYARINNPHPHRTSFELADGCNLPYPAGHFECVVSALAINFIPDAATAVREMVRVTRPEGTVAATLWDMRGGLTHLRMVLDTAAAIDQGAAEWRTRFFAAPGTPPGALAELWHQAGLKQVKETTLTVRLEFRAFADLWEPTMEAGLFGRYLRTISEVQREAIRQKVEAAYLCGDRDGPRSFAATAWAVKGTVPSPVPAPPNDR